MVMVKWTDIYIVLSYSETLILNRFNRGSRLDESTEKSNERLLCAHINLVPYFTIYTFNSIFNGSFFHFRDNI